MPEAGSRPTSLPDRCGYRRLHSRMCGSFVSGHRRGTSVPCRPLRDVAEHRPPPLKSDGIEFPINLQSTNTARCRTPPSLVLLPTTSWSRHRIHQQLHSTAGINDDSHLHELSPTNVNASPIIPNNEGSVCSGLYGAEGRSWSVDLSLSTMPSISEWGLEFLFNWPDW